MIADAGIRSEHGIMPCNLYLFASSLLSPGHVSGWHAISSARVKAHVQLGAITVTKMRHLVSMLYAVLDIREV